ncbi:glycoside hydrolase family 113 [Winogradskyella alexanderae]|uniref:Glycoside hydrolase n=1 Tax=Winogradskyella alexanderae TaxID=2877123 RepID=A0ABS7XR96_9FLAO|nr:glycoside hydrolase [Winogradskyella alexanderae]MCA0132542.1 glycoside hydrolase [Winogradskyella alexanderae]
MKRIVGIILFLLLVGCAASSYRPAKINGVSFVAAPHKIDSTHLEPVVKVNANYAAIMPFGFIRSLDNPNIIHNTDRQWFGETKVGAQQYILELQKKGIKVMIKPQIWVWRGEFTGNIMMTNEDDWQILEKSYSSFILDYADLAQTVNAEILCVGTELELFIKYRPKYWSSLIDEIRSVYTGKLTYAANWDEYRRTPFWDQLDFIGIDAYFPVSDNKTPSIEDCLLGWQKHKSEIMALAKYHKKKVLFTEYGYRSVDFAGKQPWVADRKMDNVNLQAQVNTMQALYETFWEEDWFAGGFIWKWYIEHEKVGGEANFMFTPQNKPVEEVIKIQYGQSNNY